MILLRETPARGGDVHILNQAGSVKVNAIRTALYTWLSAKSAAITKYTLVNPAGHFIQDVNNTLMITRGSGMATRVSPFQVGSMIMWMMLMLISRKSSIH